MGVPVLSHVLEAYHLPLHSTADAIREALAEMDCASCDLKWIDERTALVILPSHQAGEVQGRLRDGMVDVAAGSVLLGRAHAWLRLRRLASAPISTQTKAREWMSLLLPPRPRPATNANIARRLVENALGQRSNVTQGQRRAERKVIDEARGG